MQNSEVDLVIMDLRNCEEASASLHSMPCMEYWILSVLDSVMLLFGANPHDLLLVGF